MPRPRAGAAVKIALNAIGEGVPQNRIPSLSSSPGPSRDSHFSSVSTRGSKFASFVDQDQGLPQNDSLYKKSRRGDVEVLPGKLVVENIHEELLRTKENRANYCNLAAFLGYALLCVAILGMQRTPTQAFMIEKAIEESLFDESTSTVEYSSGDIVSSVKSIESVYSWFEEAILNTIFVDPTCGDGICDTPNEYKQWRHYGCNDDCGTYSTSLQTTVVVNITASFDSEDELADASWNLCSTTHDVCYFEEDQVFTSLNESQVNEVSLLDGVWEVQLSAQQGGIIGQIYTESTSIVTTVNLYNMTNSTTGNLTTINSTTGSESTSSTSTYYIYESEVVTTRNVIAEWAKCKSQSSTSQVAKAEEVSMQCEAATNVTTEVCSSSNCAACSKSRCIDLSECIYDSDANECQEATCGDDISLCQYCSDSQECSTTTVCTWRSSSSSCEVKCLADDCGASACQNSRTVCVGDTNGACTWDATASQPCYKATSEETTCSTDCTACQSRSKCIAESNCAWNSGSCESSGTDAYASGSCDSDCQQCANSTACASQGECLWTGSACGDASDYPCGLDCTSCSTAGTCKTQSTCAWKGSCSVSARRSRRSLETTTTETCTTASTGSCTACNDNPTKCAQKSKCEFDYEAWECLDTTETTEISEECNSASGGTCTETLMYNGICDSECNIGDCGYDDGDCSDTAIWLNYICSDLCYCNMLGDGVCDSACNTEDCGLDLGDCCETVFTTSYTVSFEIWEHSTESTIERLTPDPLVPLSRYVATYNRLIGGVLVLQQRYERGECSSTRFAKFGNECLTGASSRAPFGADPVFLRNSSLNTDNTIYKAKSSYYNVSDATQINELGVPYGFHWYRSETEVDSIEGFPVYFDTNLGYDRAQEYLAYMKEGFFLDSDSELLEIRMITYNPDIRMFANIKIEFSFEEGGRIDLSNNVETFRVESYNSDSDLHRLKLEVLFLILTVFNVISELRDLLRDFARTGRPLTYFRSGWNYIDLFNILLFFVNALIWIRFYTAWAVTYDPQERYNVYLDLDAKGNYLKVNTTGLNDMFDMIIITDHLSTLIRTYLSLNGVALVLVVLRVLKVLDFQRRMGLVTKTIANSASDLAHFLVLFMIILSLYACLAFIIFGSSISEFATLSDSFNSCFSILMGDLSVETHLFGSSSYIAALLFFYSFIFLAYFILMNVLLAILVDAYVEVKQSAEYSQSLPAEVAQMIFTGFRSLPWFRFDDKRHLSDEKIIDLTADWVVESKILEEEGKIGRRTYSIEGFTANREQLTTILESELARVRDKRDIANSAEAANLMGHKTHSPLNAILQNDTASVSKLAKQIAENIMYRYGEGEDILKPRSTQVLPAIRLSGATLRKSFAAPFSSRRRSSQSTSSSKYRSGERKNSVGQDTSPVVENSILSSEEELVGPRESAVQPTSLNEPRRKRRIILNIPAAAQARVRRMTRFQKRASYNLQGAEAISRLYTVSLEERIKEE